MLIRQTLVFHEWFRKLKDTQARTIIGQRLVRLRNGLLGDAHSVGDGVSELRIHYGPGYRVYFTIRGSDIIFLLCGGNKTSQQSDIAEAKNLAKEL